MPFDPLDRNESRRLPVWFFLPLVLAGLAVAMAVAVLVGGADLPPARVLSVLWQAVRGQRADDIAAQIVLDIRLPRIVLAMVVGAGMGLAGLASQTLFRNPLASPYVLGVSNGAAVGAVAAMLLAAGTMSGTMSGTMYSWSWSWSWSALGYGGVPVMSVFGGCIVSGIVYTMARRSGHFGHSLLLAGIAISAFCAALTAAALYLAGERLQILVFWLMGGLWQATWRDVLLVTPVTAAALVGLGALAPAMNVALVGERSAIDLGL